MGDFSEPNNIFIGFRHDPVTYVLSRRQAVSRVFDKGECNGVWHCGSTELTEVTIREAPAVLQMLKKCCVVAQKNLSCRS
jgi:hypothetical protein